MGRWTSIAVLALGLRPRFSDILELVALGMVDTLDLTRSDRGLVVLVT